MSNGEDSLKARLQADLTVAMKARDQLATSTIELSADAASLARMMRWTL